MSDDKRGCAEKRVGSSDVLERAADHLRTMAPHIRARLTAQLLEQVCSELRKDRAWFRATFGYEHSNDGD